MRSNTFGEWIKEMREQRNWTQSDLAKMLDIPQSTLSGWETGKVVNFCVDERLSRLAKTFSLHLYELPFYLLYDDEPRINHSNIKPMEVKEKKSGIENVFQKAYNF